MQSTAAITPNSAAHSNLGVALLQRGRVDDALIHYAKAVESDPSNVDPRNNMAWVLATWPEARNRNAQMAVEMAERANSLTASQSIRVSVTLAAAYAEAGRFADAVQTAQRALQLADSQGNMARVNSIRRQIELYEAGSPSRDRSPPVPLAR